MMFRNFVILSLVVSLIAFANADPVPKPKLKGVTVHVSNLFI